MSKNIILVDKRVQDYETIVAAIDADLAIGVVFDYFEDTFEAVKARIDALGNTNGNTAEISVGLVQHNYRSPMFGMVASADLAPVANVAIQDPDLALWTQFRDFIIWCKTERGAVHFDLMACALYSDNDWKYVIDTLTLQTGVTIRASTDDTGSATLGGDWFLESHTGVNLKYVYFTEAIEEYRGVLYVVAYNIRTSSTKGISIGIVVTWGYSGNGGSAPSGVTAANSGVVAVYSNKFAFAALKTDGSVVAWGLSDYGGNAPSSVTAAGSGVVAVYSTPYALAALKTDGSVVTWGQGQSGTGAPSSVTAANSGVVAVYSTEQSFAALKTDGSVVSWGNSSYGGTGNAPSSVNAANSGVVAVNSTYYAFAALKTDGSVIAWGLSDYGGTNPNISSGVVAVYSNISAFAAMKTDGSVVTWGQSNYGGTGSAPSSVTAANSGVVAVYSTQYAFAALKTDGSIIAWGSSEYGGIAPSSVTAANSGVVAVYSTLGAFAALKTDGSIVAWGSSAYGGTGAPSSVTAANSGVVAVYSTQRAFTALKTNGSVVAWGNSDYGGTGAPSGVTAANSGVVAVYSNNDAFAALKTDGSVVAWAYSGDVTAPISVTAANSGVVAVYSAAQAFAALKSTANTFDLSASYYTDMDRYNILRKQENRRRVNLTILNNNVFTLSQARDIQSFNSAIPMDKVFRIIVPTYTSSPLSVTSSATVPNSYNLGSVIIACDESEPVSISGTTYINYGSLVYTVNASGSYVKTTSATINGLPYSLYGGDGINSSGIALLDARQTSTITTFTVASSKIVGDEPFAITTPRPTSNRSGAITYSSTNTAVATIDASGDFITAVGGGDVSFIATQEGNIDYEPTTKTSNTLTVTRLTSTFSAATFAVASSKTYGDASFNVITAPTSDSSGAITYSSSNTAVATIDASGNFISLVAAGSVSFIATQAQTSQYASATNTSNTLTVALGTSNLSSSSTFEVASSKTYGDASFAITTRPTSNSAGAITYSSSNTAVATIDASGNSISLVAAGEVSFIATQAQTSQYTSATKTSNMLTVSLGTSNLSSSSTFTVASVKIVSDASFAIIARPTSNSSGEITYSSSDPAIATIDASGNFISLIGVVGDVSFIATQAETSQYASATKTSNTLAVRLTSTFSAATFAVASSKTYGDASFNITTTPTSNSDGAITYSSSDTAVATIDASGNYISLIGAGEVTFIATQAQTSQYASSTNTSNTLTVALATSNLSSSSTFVVASSKTYGDAPFAITTSPTSNSAGAITYSSSNTAVATIDASGNYISLVSAGEVSFIATQAATSQYASATKTSNTLTVSLGTPTLSASTFSIASSKAYGDAPFAIITRPTSNSGGAITYSSSNTAVATIDTSGDSISLVGVGQVSFIATQAETSQYESATKTSNTLTVSKGVTTLAFVSPPTSKNMSEIFTVTATSASSGAVTYTSSNTSLATVGLSTGLVSLKSVGTVTITAAQVLSALYNAPTNTTCSIVISAAGSALAGQTVSPGSSYADVDFSGAILTGSTLSGVSFSGASLINTDFSGATITGANFTNANISGASLINADLSGAVITGTEFTNANINGATNLPVFSTVQKLQLLKNINNIGVGTIQINTQVSGADINAMLPISVFAIASATFTVKAPTALDASSNKIVTISDADISNNTSVYVPLNANETVNINGTVFSFNGTNLFDVSNNPIPYLTVEGVPFRIYAGSVIALNMSESLNEVKIMGDGVYNIIAELFASK